MKNAVAGLGAGWPSEEAARSRDGCREESLLFAEVVLVVVVVRGVLDAGLGVDAALRSSASAQTATWAASGRSGGGAGRLASEAFSARTGRGGVEVEDAPQPPTWRAKIRRSFPGTR